MTLELDGAEGFAPAADDLALFTAELARWGDDGLKAWTPEEAESGEDDAHAALDAPDTLLLTAQIDPAIDGEYAYLWRFNGVVHRLLFNSGVEYVVLRVGDRVSPSPRRASPPAPPIPTSKPPASPRANLITRCGCPARRWTPHRRAVVEVAVEEEVYPLTDDETQPM